MSQLSARPTQVMLLPLLAALASGCGFPENAMQPVIEITPSVPEGWGATVGQQGRLGLTPSERHGGNTALVVSGPTTAIDPTKANPAIITQSIRADGYRGKRVRWSAWLKPLDVKDVGASGLWMRIDGPGTLESFDNMQTRPVTGSGDWRQVSVVLDVPMNALRISMGVLFSAHNTLFLDDFALDVVGNDVASTSISGPQPSAFGDSATIAAASSFLSSVPVNLDFEGIAPPGAATADWLARNSVALTTSDPTAALVDLAPLKAMIGNAHVVGLGEGTHGTREFFQMKHRIVKYLVTQLGFTHFAIEATSPEADDINRYVLTGAGDPSKLLSRLYFWTWRTQEVLDMIVWMREWNTTAPPDRRVQFFGLDIQYPGAAMDSVLAFVGRVDATSKDVVADRFACIAPYRNNGPLFNRPTSTYPATVAGGQPACAASLQAVYDLLKNAKAAYETASSPAEYEAALHSARLVQQFEKWAAAQSSTTLGYVWTRDTSMAENLVRIRGRAGADAKIVVWAHNDHINAAPPYFGAQLRSAYGADYLALGFAFGRGTFSAVTQTGGSFLFPATQTATTIPTGSVEATFEAAGKPRALFDTRLIPLGGSAAAPLAGPIEMRSIGSAFDVTRELTYFQRRRFPADFDLLIYLSTGSASTRLPENY
jgi:erythromycin esterase